MLGLKVGVNPEAGSSANFWKLAAIVVLFSTLVRVGLWFVYEPIEYSDSGAYFRLAASLEDLSLDGYDGTRVPGYPLFIALLGQDPTAIWIVQMVLGVLSSLVLCWLTWATVGDPKVAVAVGGLNAVFPATLLFEANLLTESLTAFLITVILALLLVYERLGAHLGRLALAACLGISASMVGLVRPIFFPLTLWLIPFVWLKGGQDWKEKLTALGIFAAFPLLMQGGWLFYMQDHYHVTSPTAIAGYSMVQHSGEFFEDLPDQYSTIRDVYIEYREAQIAARGTQNNAIWQAVPALSEATNLSFYELSRRLSDLSWMLIRAHPYGYFMNLVEGWIWFWKAPVYWRADAVVSSFLQQLFKAWVLIGRAVALCANLSFLLLSGGFALSRKVRNWVRIDAMSVFIVGLIWWVSILQTVFEHGDNPRFLVPLQMIVIYIVVRTIATTRRSRIIPG